MKDHLHLRLLLPPNRRSLQKRHQMLPNLQFVSKRLVFVNEAVLVPPDLTTLFFSTPIHSLRMTFWSFSGRQIIACLPTML
jgi:hypothetical protein